ncbi:hypothetical protein KDL45_15775, partial [bacterium]|nr:hypothetical protein [bacterium]
LVALALIESLRSDYAIPDDLRADWNAKLDGYLAFLQAMQLDNGHISRGFNTLTKTSSRGYSPYYDGESLLAMVKAAKYLDRKSLVPTIEKAARAMAETYTVKAWAKNRDSDQTKGFYQWGSMSFEEYGGAGWKDADLYEDITLVLGWWMIHTHQTLRRTRNTAYAHEGIASAYAIAKRRENKAAMNDLGFAIDYGLSKLISWQVEGPLIKENRFLQAHRTDDPIAVGGVMNHRSEAPLRIDVTQHQSHALLLALQHLYSD